MSALPDTDHVSRYCKPSTVGEDGLPTEQAFSLRPGEDHLSVNWLEYLGDPSHAGITGYEDGDLTVRLALAQLVTSQDVHPAVDSD